VRFSRDLFRQPVSNKREEDLGRLADFVINPANGKILYAALRHEVSPGSAPKFFAVPWAALTIVPKHGDAQGANLLLNVEKQVLDNSEGFNPKDWPSQPNMTLFKIPSKQYP
jgi:hypothetical protein